MTPKEKAEELVLKFKQLPQEGTLAWYLSFELSKQCALIAVDEILETLKIYLEKDTASKSVVNFAVSRIMYWVQVKKEIEAL
jgi:hypothetical protein